MSMHKRLRELREHLRLTQQQLGRELEISGSVISSMEREKSPLMERTIHLLALKFRVRAEWLRDGTGEMIEPEAPARTEDEIKLVEAFRTLSDEMQAIVLHKIKDMVALQQASWAEAAPKENKN